MKPHCPQCKRIIELLAAAFEDLHSNDPEKACAAELTLSMVIDEKYELIEGTDRWHNPAEGHPAELFCPGVFMHDELRVRRWSVKRFASYIGLSVPFTQGILSGKEGLSRGIAARIADAFGTSVEIWLNLEKSYRDHLARQAAPSGERGPR